MPLRRALSLCCLLLLTALAACGGGGAPDGGDGAGGGQNAGERRFLSVGTAPAGGAFFVVGGALADVLSEHGPEGWQVTAEATAGSQENIRRVSGGELDVALSNAAITYFAVRGTEGWEKAYPVQAVMTLAPNVALFVAPKGNGVETLEDLKGKRVVVGPAGAGFEYFVRPLLAAHGVSYDDFTPLYNTQAGTVDMLTDGSAAAAFIGGAVPTASLVQAAGSQDLVFVPFDPEIREGLIRDYEFFRPAVIPAGTYRGLEEDFQGLDVGSMHLIVAADEEEETVYQITKTLYENRQAVVDKHPAGRAINPNNAARDTGTEFHPGAVRYYKEIGIWPETATPGDATEGESAP